MSVADFNQPLCTDDDIAQTHSFAVEIQAEDQDETLSSDVLSLHGGGGGGFLMGLRRVIEFLFSRQCVLVGLPLFLAVLGLLFCYQGLDLALAFAYMMGVTVLWGLIGMAVFLFAFAYLHAALAMPYFCDGKEGQIGRGGAAVFILGFFVGGCPAASVALLGAIWRFQIEQISESVSQFLVSTGQVLIMSFWIGGAACLYRCVEFVLPSWIYSPGSRHGLWQGLYGLGFIALYVVVPCLIVVDVLQIKLA